MAKNKSKGAIKSISKYGLLIPTALGNLATKGLEKITGKKYGRTTAEELSKTTAGKILGTAIVGTGAAAAIAAQPAIALKAAKAITPKTAVGKTLGLVTAGAVLTSPTIATAVLEAPLNLINTGKKIGKEVESSPDDLKETASKAGKYGLLALGAAGLIGAGAGALTNELLNQKETLLQNKEGVLVQPETTSYLDAPEPTEYETISTTKKRKRKAVVKDYPKVNQSVRIMINNSSRGLTINNKKYIKELCYA